MQFYPDSQAHHEWKLMGLGRSNGSSYLPGNWCAAHFFGRAFTHFNFQSGQQATIALGARTKTLQLLLLLDESWALTL